jgi:hypothetical protein
MTLWSMTPVSKQAKLVNRVTGRPWTGTGAGRTPKNNFLRSDSAANGRPKVPNYELMLTSPLVAVTAFLMKVSSTFMSTSASLPGYPDSHGCVRMPLAFAKLLYKASPMGMTVVITDLEELPRVAPTPDLLQSIAANAAASREVSATDRARVTMPDDFRDRLNGELTPGVTLVVTADSLRAGETGKSLTVIEADT